MPTLAVGVDIKDVLVVKEERRTRNRFNSETGEPIPFEYTQIIYEICGREIPITRKDLLKNSFGIDYEAGYNIANELTVWLESNGFCQHLIFCFHSTASHIAPSGVLGLSAWDYRPEQPDHYGYLGGPRGNCRAVHEKSTGLAAKKVAELLVKIGCDRRPELYVVQNG